MAAATMPTDTRRDDPLVPWWMTLLAGIALVIAGFMVWRNPAGGTVFLVQVMGWFWLFSGIMSIVKIFIDRRMWGWNLFMGIVGIIAGLWIVQNPIQGAVAALVAIVIVLGVQALVFGTVALIGAFQGGGWGAGILGVVSIILGLLLLFNNILVTSLAVPWVFAIFAMVGGVAEIVGAFMQRSREQAAARM